MKELTNGGTREEMLLMLEKWSPLRFLATIFSGIIACVNGKGNRKLHRIF